jgi:hypothetical protein
MGLKTAVGHFDFQYVVKVDTDTYVDIPRMIDYLDKVGSTTFYAGVLGLGPCNPFIHCFPLCCVQILILFCRFFSMKEFGWRTMDTTKREPCEYFLFCFFLLLKLLIFDSEEANVVYVRWWICTFLQLGTVSNLSH